MGVRVREKPPGSGTFWIFINHKGRRKSKKIGPDEGLANEVAQKIAAKLTLGEFDLIQDDKSEALAFKDYCVLWLDDYISR